MLLHLTARARRGLAPFLIFAVAALAWRRLRAAFPAALACVLMPEHVHLVCEVEDAGAARRRLASVLSGLARSRAGGDGAAAWAPVPSPTVVADARHLRRFVRYVALNPCRAKLVKDPLRWLWSTHRDVVGAVADPWITPERLAAALHLPLRGFAAAYHAYVSADPTVNVAGTPAPRPAAPTPCPRYSLEVVRLGAAVALRAPVETVAQRTMARRLFVQLAGHQGWRDPAAVGALCGLAPRAVHRLPPPPPAVLAAGLLCLGDARLLDPSPQGWSIGAAPAPDWSSRSTSDPDEGTTCEIDF